MKIRVSATDGGAVREKEERGARSERREGGEGERLGEGGETEEKWVLRSAPITPPFYPHPSRRVRLCNRTRTDHDRKGPLLICHLGLEFQPREHPSGDEKTHLRSHVRLASKTDRARFAPITLSFHTSQGYMTPRIAARHIANCQYFWPPSTATCTAHTTAQRSFAAL